MTFEGMFEQAKERLLPHLGHNIEIGNYGTEKFPINIAIECMDCNEVLIDFTDEPKKGDEAAQDPQRPTESEVRLLAYAYTDSSLVAEDSEDREQAIEDEVQGPGGGLEQVQSAYIAVFRNYITGGPGYMGAVYAIVWDGAPEFVSVAYWEKEPKRLKMIHYGDV